MLYGFGVGLNVKNIHQRELERLSARYPGHSRAGVEVRIWVGGVFSVSTKGLMLDKLSIFRETNTYFNHGVPGTFVAQFSKCC